MFPLCPKAPASSKHERDPGPCAIEGTRRGVRCKAGRPPRPPALTLARPPPGPGVQDRADNPRAPGLPTFRVHELEPRAYAAAEESRRSPPRLPPRPAAQPPGSHRLRDPPAGRREPDPRDHHVVPHEERDHAPEERRHRVRREAQADEGGHRRLVHGAPDTRPGTGLNGAHRIRTPSPAISRRVHPDCAVKISRALSRHYLGAVG